MQTQIKNDTNINNNNNNVQSESDESNNRLYKTMLHTCPEDIIKK